MAGRQTPEQADIIFGAVEGVYGPQNTLMLWRFIIAGTKERFEVKATRTLNPPPNTSQAWGVVIHLFEASARSARPQVGR
jgi:hypothetical protein